MKYLDFTGIFVYAEEYLGKGKNNDDKKDVSDDWKIYSKGFYLFYNSNFFGCCYFILL